MDISPNTREQIATEAVEWLLQFQNPTRSSPDREAFSNWLMRSPVHIEEYLEVSSTWVALNVPQGAEFSTDSLIAVAREASPDNVVSLGAHRAQNLAVPGVQRSGPQRQSSVDRPPRAVRRRWLGLVASVTIGAGTWLTYMGWHHDPDFKTAIGEQRSISLSDGSVFFLNTNSEVRARWTATERHIDLIRGEARFQVAKDAARPFLVFTRDATVRAVGTIFNVRSDQSDTEVAVIEGRVKVSALRQVADESSTHEPAQGCPTQVT
jgi:transmembrane sensor